MVFPPVDFESTASANSAILARGAPEDSFGCAALLRRATSAERGQGAFERGIGGFGRTLTQARQGEQREHAR